jgi:photosystem II stability/assembly factor-like uncharacterized protein
VRYKLIAALVVVAVLAVAAAVVVPRHHSEPWGESATKAEAEAPPDDWLLTQRLAGRSVITPAALDRAAAQAAQIDELTAQAAPQVGALPWQFQGPVEIGGRVLDIALDPKAADTLFVASASGGVWKSTDAGGTFASVWPASRNSAVGALAMTPSGKLYAGTGEAGPGGGSITFGNRGVYVTSDGGAHWSSLGLAKTQRISRVAIDPTNERRIFVAATGPLFTPGGQRGVFRSDDAGAHWKLVLAGDNPTTGASDVLIDPSNPSRIYAVMWDHLREPARRRYGGPGSGIFRSDDGGNTWQRLGGGLPPPEAKAGRIGLGLAPSNPGRLYAIYVDAVGFFTGFYSSTDGGTTWTKLPDNSQLAQSQASYGWWFARIWVDPAADLHVFVAGVPLMESTTGGMSWSAQGGFHADQHAMAWDPKKQGRVYLGNDGGVYRSSTNASPPWTKATVQPFTQFYTVDVSQQDPSRIVGGAQDNGCDRSWRSNGPGWNAYGCGDGLETLINYANQQIVYGCSQYGFCIRSLNGGDSSGGIGATTSARRNWLTPLVFDPNNPDVMYYAGDIVNRSTNGGVSWTAISPDLTGGDPYPGPEEPYPFGTVTTVGPAKTDAKTLYAGTDDARVWYTHDLGKTWTRSSDPDLPDRWVTAVVADPIDAAVAYATFSGFRNGDDTPYVLKTVDGGTSWADITGNLPHAPVNALIIDGSRLVVGTDLGVYTTTDGGVKWFRLGKGLPRSSVTGLRVQQPTRTLYASTFGRGTWKVALPGS